MLGPRFADAKPVGMGSPLHLPGDKLGSEVVHGVAQGCPRKFRAPFFFLFFFLALSLGFFPRLSEKALYLFESQ